MGVERALQNAGATTATSCASATHELMYEEVACEWRRCGGGEGRDLVDREGLGGTRRRASVKFAVISGGGRGRPRVVLVISGAMRRACPCSASTRRPSDVGTLQAVAAVGQPGSDRVDALCSAGTGSSAARSCSRRTTSRSGVNTSTAGDVAAFARARRTAGRQRERHVADDEIRFGDNDRLAALVRICRHADVLVMLTDTSWVFTADPRQDADASLIEEIVEVDEALERVAGGAGTKRGSGGMASKLAGREDRRMVGRP